MILMTLKEAKPKYFSKQNTTLIRLKGAIRGVKNQSFQLNQSIVFITIFFLTLGLFAKCVPCDIFADLPNVSLLRYTWRELFALNIWPKAHDNYRTSVIF